MVGTTIHPGDVRAARHVSLHGATSFVAGAERVNAVAIAGALLAVSFPAAVSSALVWARLSPGRGTAAAAYSNIASYVPSRASTSSTWNPRPRAKRTKPA